MDQPVVTPQVTSTVIELRQYAMQPGRRDELIEIFEERLMDDLRSSGMALHGQFRDTARPDRFVWMRGFADLASRPVALDRFYSGPVWKQNREAANATMDDVGDVLLLQPVPPAKAFALPGKLGAIVVATIYLLQATVDPAFVRFYRDDIRPAVTAAGATPVAELQSLEVPNNYPRLPMREGEHAFVWFASFKDEGAYRDYRRRLEASGAWKAVEAALASRLAQPAQDLVLAPTSKTRGLP